MNSRVDPAILSEGWHADTYIQAENSISVVSDREFSEVCERLVVELGRAGLAVSHVTAFGPEDGRYAESGAPALAFRVRVFDVADPIHAARLLTIDPDLACLVPHRIAVYERHGCVTAVTPRPTALIGEFSGSSRAARVAQSAESSLRQVLRAIV